MGEIVIDLNNISKSFGKETVLWPVNLSFERGKIYGLVGRNGSGKSVLLKIICGFLKPDSGTVKINGVALGRKREFPDNTGILIEKPGFLLNQNAFQTLKSLSCIKKQIGDEEIRQVLDVVGLGNAGKKPVGKFSLGMKQRLGIAQAIMENPDILLLDEPMNGLDDRGVAEMRDLFRQYRAERRTILLASHIQEDIKGLCDVVYRIDGGRIRMDPDFAKQ
ncbi:MAG: ATP-binding cassette domain-containing protein [Clostridiales bacterium]|nr:ATP-binding cassette domain-containing protein [Clostridiales bacterium]